MNIFFLDAEPEIAAQSLCDKHVVKMVLESTQLLCTAHRLLPMWELPPIFYKQTHINHPCSLWVRNCAANYCWMAYYSIKLSKEYTFRYGKKHKSHDIIEWCLDNIPGVPLGSSTTIRIGTWQIDNPPQCMPDEYKNDDPVIAYRNYYNFNKIPNMKCTWTKREKPSWVIK